MTGREALGVADVSDDVLAAMVARSHGSGVTGELLDVEVVEVPYDLEAITTGGRHRVRGSARYGDLVRPFSMFVKQVRSWERSPLFAHVPPEVREFATTNVPWRTEALVYRSDLASRLPDGLSMPEAFGVFDTDEKSASIWLEDVAAVEAAWDLPRFENAAFLLGAMSGSPAVAPLAGVGGFSWTPMAYVEGRVKHQVVPMLHADPLWQHPLITGSFDAGLRARLLEAADRVAAYGVELGSLPTAAGHGDACPSNLLVRADVDGFTLIDFGFWLELPVGFDLGQLLVGDVQLGRRGTEDLVERDEACLAAYLEGLRSEGFTIAESDVRRVHALQLLLFTGLSAIPVEHLEQPMTDELVALAADRATLARYALDLVDATG